MLLLPGCDCAGFEEDGTCPPIAIHPETELAAALAAGAFAPDVLWSLSSPD
ncbi:hypothetical protein [Salibaculum halophilum]|uniref:hypothetical protein n=1 Tax=Salibaculum halophilum TaxID=1914408 RepID=UPI0015C44BDA|nr:hypothetical protein [Salibaculum halophilum]